MQKCRNPEEGVSLRCKGKMGPKQLPVLLRKVPCYKYRSLRPLYARTRNPSKEPAIKEPTRIKVTMLAKLRW